MAEDFIPKLRINAVLSGTVVSDVFPVKFKKKVGNEFLDDADGWVFNVEMPVEGAPPVTIQLQTLDKPEKGDTIDFPMKLETNLRMKYSIKQMCVIHGPKKISKDSKPSPVSAVN